MPTVERIMRLLASLEELPGVRRDEEESLQELVRHALAEKNLSLRAAEDKYGVGRAVLHAITRGTWDTVDPTPESTEGLSKLVGRKPWEIRELARRGAATRQGESAERLAARIAQLRPRRRELVSQLVTYLLAEQEAEIQAERANRVMLRLVEAAARDEDAARVISRTLRGLQDIADPPDHVSGLSPRVQRQLAKALTEE